MKRFGLVFLVVAAMATPAMAGSVRVEGTYGPYQTGTGGEFTLVNIDGFSPSAYASTTSNQGYANSFQTFCIEATGNEHIYTNTTYNAALNQNAVLGGTGAPLGGDPVSVGTGWLYSQFALGTLAGYNYGANRTISAGLLQQAFWCLEDEAACSISGVSYTNVFVQAAVNHFGTLAAAKDHGGWNYGVYAINMWVGNDPIAGRRQDQLFFTGIPVPDGGATLALLGCALLGLGVLRRKFTS